VIVFTKYCERMPRLCAPVANACGTMCCACAERSCTGPSNMCSCSTRSSALVLLAIRSWLAPGKQWNLDSQCCWMNMACMFRPHCAGNTSAYIWTSWGYLEYLTNNVSRARKLYDAAIVVDETHVAAWHQWGELEHKQGNYLRARCVYGERLCCRLPSCGTVCGRCASACEFTHALDHPRVA